MKMKIKIKIKDIFRFSFYIYKMNLKKSYYILVTTWLLII